MKTVPVEQLDERISKAIDEQDEHEAIRLTKDENAVAWMLRLPDAMKDAEAEIVIFREGPRGRIFVVVEAKHGDREQPNEPVHSPVFGAGRGALTVISEDDDHLKDFEEYMK